MKFRKSHFFLLAVLLVTGIMVRYVFSDRNLDLDLLRKSLENMPVVVLEDLEFEREISGDIWSARIPAAKRQDRVVEVLSIDVRRRIAGGGEWYFLGARGLYSEAGESADLSGLLGTLETDTRVLNLESERLSWSNGTNAFLFPNGLTIYDSEFILETSLASFDSSGSMAFEEGAVVRWKKLPRQPEN